MVTLSPLFTLESEPDELLEALSGLELAEGDLSVVFDLLEKWNTKGKKLTAEHRKKISDALKGRGTHKTKAFKGGATGAGTGKGALAKRHPVGTRVHTKDGVLTVTGHASGYIGVEGGKKKWYKLSELQDQAPKVAAKTTGKVDGSGLKTKAKTGPEPSAVSQGRRSGPYHEAAEAKFQEYEAFKGRVEEIRKKRSEADTIAYKAYQAQGKQFYGSALHKERQDKRAVLDAVNEAKGAKLIDEYVAAVDRRNTESYQADIKAGVKRQKPVTSEDLHKVGTDLTHVDPKDVGMYSFNPEVKALQKRVDESGEAEWFRASDGEGGTRWMFYAGSSTEGRQRAFGYNDTTPQKADFSSPEKYKRAAEKAGLVREMYEAREHNMSLDEYRGVLTAKAQKLHDDAMTTGGVFIRSSPSTITKIMAGGGLLTQHETQPNKETTAKRKVIEKTIFGTPEDGSKGHPTYGYVSGDPLGRVTKHSALGGGAGKKGSKEEYTGSDWLDGYGGAAMKLKPEAVKPFMTVTHGDTADIVYAGHTSSALNPSKLDHTFFSRQLVGDGHRERALMARERSPLDYKGGVDDQFAHEVHAWGQTGYMEAQFHNKVMPNHIAEVIFPAKPSAAVLKSLKAAGIPWKLIEGAE